MSADSDQIESEGEIIIEKIPSYDIRNGLRNLIFQVDKLTQILPFDARVVDALVDIHLNRVSEDAVDECLKIIETRLETFAKEEKERLVYEGGDVNLRWMRFTIDHALYVECFRDN